MRRLLSLWGPVAAYVALLFWISDRSTLPDFVVSVWDKLLHAGAWSLLTGLLLRATHGGLLTLRRGPAASAVMVAVLYGVLDEVHQSFVPGREASPADAAADLAGAVLALLLWAVAARARRPIIARFQGRQER